MFEFSKNHPNLCILILAALIICAVILNKYVVVKLSPKIKRVVQGIGIAAMIFALGFNVYSIFF